MGFSYSEVAETGLIDEEVLENIPSTCDGEYGCGEELEFTDNLTQLYCPNRFCTHKIAARLEAMAKEMKADGWGESTCLEVVKRFKLLSPAMVFFIEKLPAEKYPYDLKVSAFQTKLANICDPEKRKVKLWEVVKLMNIPGIASNARKIFDGYNTMEEAYDDIESKQIPLIAEKLGMSVKSESGVLVINTYNTLLEYKDELLAAQRHFEIYRPEGRQISMAITGGVVGYTNKQEFVSHLNRKFKGKCDVVLGTVNSSLDVLIADNPTNSSKYKSATRINEKASLTGGHKIVICTHEECERLLEELFKQGQ